MTVVTNSIEMTLSTLRELRTKFETAPYVQKFLEEHEQQDGARWVRVTSDSVYFKQEWK